MSNRRYHLRHMFTNEETWQHYSKVGERIMMVVMCVFLVTLCLTVITAIITGGIYLTLHNH